MSALNYPKAIQPSSPKSARTIFDGPGQHVTCDPSHIRLLSDRCLIRDLPQDDSRCGSLVVPETAQTGGVGKNGLLRIGIVVAVGEGDRYREAGLDTEGAVRRRLLTKPCPRCDGVGFDPNCPALPSLVEWDGQLRALGAGCPKCNAEGRVPVLIPPQCNVGDTVLYDRFRSAELIINGERFQLTHAEQTVFAVLEEG